MTDFTQPTSPTDQTTLNAATKVPARAGFTSSFDQVPARIGFTPATADDL
jgi:hypothetical protein